jgi:ATP-binding cassette subfamily C (CFTR/MRP) protein 1
MDLTGSTLAVVAQLSLIFVFAPWSGAVVPLILIPYTLIFANIRVGARDARRLESLAKSPVYTFFNDMVSGRSTIHAFGAMRRFEAKGTY